MTGAPTTIEPAAAPSERFQLLHELGRGGMGVVYLAEDSTSGARCAVKILHPQLTQDEISVARFRTEASTASKINHDAIIKLLGDIHRLPDGRWCFAMEYLDGQTLAQLVAQRGPLPLTLAIEILAPICEALNMAHAANIVHRDLKLDNVIVMLRADGHVPKLLDFGIAKLLGEPGVTHPGVTPGTTAHMAPEQLRGDPVDRRSDVYALGVLTYQMITGGQLPYDVPDGTLYHAQMTQPPIDPRKRCAAVPEQAVGPLLAAIHPDPLQRPATAGDFVLALARVLVGTTPETDGMGIVQRRAPRLLMATNLQETLRAPGVGRMRASASWSYTYGAPLGKGGFGEVYRGVKHGAPGFVLPVAIKRIVREHAENPAFVELFHQEARIAALLGEHPNIVKIIDHLTDPEGQLAIVMEFIDGADLGKLRESGPLPYSVIIYLMSELLEGLGHAHDLPLPGVLSSPQEIAARGQVRGIIHRDMSHHNVMVSRHGAVKVMDFGIAKLRQATVAPGSDIIKGKPGYMSPEQANTAVEIDGRSDLFAVGIMLWELLTGELLFARHDDYRVVIAAVLFHPIQRPALYRPDVPAELEAVAMRLLQRDPAARYQTAREACAALMACPGASRNARAELQQLLRARFPSADTPVADGPHTLVAPWRPESTTHSHAVGQSVAAVPTQRRRVPRLAAILVAGGLGLGAAVGLLARRHGSDVVPAAADPAPPPPTEIATPARTEPTSSPLAQAAPRSPALPAMSTVAVATEPTGAMVRIQDATKLIAAGRSPLTVFVPQGAQIKIRADVSGFESTSKAVTIGELDQQTVTLSLPRLAGAAPASRSPRAIAPSPKRPASSSRAPEANDQILE